MLFNYSQIISAILPIPSHFLVVAADFPVFTLCEGTENPADSFVLVREKKTKIVISTTENANIKSVIDRLKRLNLVRTIMDPNDGRRHLVGLSPLGKVLIERSIPRASLAAEKTLSPLSEEEQVIFLSCYKNIEFGLTSIFT